MHQTVKVHSAFYRGNDPRGKKPTMTSKTSAPKFEISYQLPGKTPARKVVTEAKLEKTLAELEDKGAMNVLVREAE